MPDDKLVNNALVLANAIELSVGVIEQIAGNAIATTLEGEVVSREELRELAANRLEVSLVKHTGEL